MMDTLREWCFFLFLYKINLYFSYLRSRHQKKIIMLNEQFLHFLGQIDARNYKDYYCTKYATSTIFIKTKKATYKTHSIYKSNQSTSIFLIHNLERNKKNETNIYTMLQHKILRVMLTHSSSISQIQYDTNTCIDTSNIRYTIKHYI